MEPLKILTEVFVPGRPRMKGSVVMVTPTHARQSDVEVGQYQRLITQSVITDRARYSRHRAPAGVAVAVRMVFWVPGSDRGGAGAAAAQPVRPRSGDIDKMTRAVLDALTKAEAYEDDVQVVKIMAEQYWADLGGHAPGTLIQAWIQPENAARAGWHAAMQLRDDVRARQNARGVTV